MYTSERNTNWKYKLVPLLRSMSNCNDGDGEPVNQGKQISQMNCFKSLFCFFNYCWYSDWEVFIVILENISLKKLSEKSIDKILEQFLWRSFFKSQVSWKIAALENIFDKTLVIGSSFHRFRLNKIHPPSQILANKKFIGKFTYHSQGIWFYKSFSLLK